MSNFIEKLNFSESESQAPERAIELFVNGRDIGYYYDNLCLYCADNDVDLTEVSSDEFYNAAEVMSQHASCAGIDTYFFWID